ncbi:hypothetical protein S245_060781, partial [Arachis hypogaea]
QHTLLTRFLFRAFWFCPQTNPSHLTSTTGAGSEALPPSIALSSCSRSPTPVHSHSLANCSFFVEIDIR